jgi:hypothetical protein
MVYFRDYWSCVSGELFGISSVEAAVPAAKRTIPCRRHACHYSSSSTFAIFLAATNQRAYNESA